MCLSVEVRRKMDELADHLRRYGVNVGALRGGAEFRGYEVWGVAAQVQDEG